VARRRNGGGSGGKIKNWSSVESGEYWRNDKTRDTIKLINTRRPQHSEKWVVELDKTDGPRRGKTTIDGAFTKEGARQKAVDWMRRHPLAGRNDTQELLSIGDKIIYQGTTFNVKNIKNGEVFLREDKSFPPRRIFWIKESKLEQRGYERV